ncbi:hypothetical protein wcw_0865 [Waddlia chondrophila WSU 86-1044]|uniref:Uncharacterized protein n=1 Tax=Waddlia chondrophila (strain ATCC VR-1470 / WSU 86-1044) TaxID=716544 RepID=D6YVS0_WADCW|nr:hypothetical protein wcw_0865 [Waddlia chondrophila WSU 86-1044]
MFPAPKNIENIANPVDRVLDFIFVDMILLSLKF